MVRLRCQEELAARCLEFAMLTARTGSIVYRGGNQGAAECHSISQEELAHRAGIHRSVCAPGRTLGRPLDFLSRICNNLESGVVPRDAELKSAACLGV